MADIFREVDEELKADRASALAKKYGPYLIGFVLAIVLGTLGYNLWQDWDLERRSERSDHYAAALALTDDGETEAALAALAELGEPDGGYGTLATFERARLLADDGRRDEALALWSILAANEAAGPALQGVARLFFVMHQIDDGDPGELRAMLAPLFTAGNGFRPLAMELDAILALREGDRARARQLYTEIADDLTAPPGLRARAAQVLASLGEGEAQ
ncbi:MAG: tetratricopeptide repeat protein [Kiloniellales bacterium]|nr:tetratricopeptide repeat protein [Kiloniellales bacterium]